MPPTCPESSSPATSSATVHRAEILSIRYGVCEHDWPGLLLWDCPPKAPLPVCPISLLLLSFTFLRAKDSDGLWVFP